ncbi:ABC transporter ATP-binding protein [Martelella sp. HB161492]|uniref:ABC transporter ATP-binding protein n=1 Tax=Martelella sp. HB161492 TaxID=2720726 RepID=UPI001AEE6543|nr:ABC transporter ATP-binding protein [Martelella sp. HB161492]
METLLELKDLSAGYGGKAIVHGVSFALQKGSITTLVGGNGAGKSTLMRAIYGSCDHLGGSVVFRGQAIEKADPFDRHRMGIGFVPQGRCNFAEMTVSENLKMGCYTLPAREHAKRIEHMLEAFPVLKRKYRLKAGNMSGGEQQILETAMVLLAEPSMLLLDEPSLGLSPKTQGEVFDMVREIAARGVTVLIVEQNVHGALLISDTAIVLEMGRKFLEGPANDVRNDPNIRHAYLGGNITKDISE